MTETLKSRRQQWNKVRESNQYRKLKADLLESQEQKCFYCHDNLWTEEEMIFLNRYDDDGNPIESPTVMRFYSFAFDHVVPLSLSGTNEPDNLVLACYPCNSSKGKKLDWQPK